MDEPGTQDLHYEIINGNVNIMARPGLNHLTISFNVGKIFERFIDNSECKMFVEAALHLDDRYIFVPDVSIVFDRDKRRGNAIYGAPDLIVEVLSPSTAKYDLSVKKDIYEQYGVREYWIIFPESRMITVYQNIDKRFMLLDAYTYRHPDEMDYMTEQDRKSLSAGFSTNLFEGLIINLEEVFRGTE